MDAVDNNSPFPFVLEQLRRHTETAAFFGLNHHCFTQHVSSSHLNTARRLLLCAQLSSACGRSIMKPTLFFFGVKMPRQIESGAPARWTDRTGLRANRSDLGSAPAHPRLRCASHQIIPSRLPSSKSDTATQCPFPLVLGAKIKAPAILFKPSSPPHYERAATPPPLIRLSPISTYARVSSSMPPTSSTCNASFHPSHPGSRSASSLQSWSFFQKENTTRPQHTNQHYGPTRCADWFPSSSLGTV